MRTLLPIGFLVLLAGPVACGPAPTPVAPGAQQTGDVKPAPAQVAASAPLDLSPVPEPADVVGVVRWANPAATIANLTACAGLPPQLTEGNTRALVEEILGEAIGDSAAKQLGPVVALDAPLHVVVALDPRSKRGRAIAAGAIGLVSLERARGALESAGPLTEVAPGMWKIGGKERSGASCALAASAGSTPARLVCGDNDKDVTALGPYLARTMPTLAAEGRDLRGELRLVPFSAKFGGLAKQQLRGLPILAQSQWSIGEPKFDKALVEAATAIQDELTALVDDADRVTFDLGVDSRTCLTGSEGIQLRGKASWFAGTLADTASRAGAPPAHYWRLPKDSAAAFFGRGADPARYTEILKNLRALLEGWLTKENVGSAADRKALADLIAMPLGKDTSSVSAHGAADAAAAPPRKAGAKPGVQEAVDAMVASWVGWNLAGVDEGPTATLKYFKDFVAVYNRPGLQNALKKELGPEDAKLLPTMKTAPAPKELGKNSLAVEIRFNNIPAPEDLGPLAQDKPGAKAKPLTLTMHLLLMGEEKATWIAFGMDKAELVRRLGMVKTGAPDAGTLASRPGLDTLKSGKLISGGYFTIAPITRAFAAGFGFATGAMPGALPPEVQQMMNLLNNLPHKGDGPMFFTVQAQGGGAPRAEVSFNVTKPALEDIGALVMGALKVAGAFNP